MGDYALSGLLPGGSSSVFLFSASQYDERWAEAELRTAELIGRIQPSRPSEERRKAVTEYVERLIQRYFDCQVFTFGSVPLKTYLPDGDIDLTAFSWLQHLNDTWANDLRRILENEEHSKDAEFRVKEVQCIHAEVQIVKCLVENIIVDISFNQLGGLCTLCFLEEVDRLIGKDHLFKRSIILVKAWCYYESRILGAHYGLISTYALETLVLYIFHVFHSSLRGPLEVLFRFLEFFSKFDWDHYCLSLWGPIRLSALQDMAAEPPHIHGGKLLLSQAFLYACSQAYAVLPGSQDTQGRTFSPKFMNVVDPLRTNNNLGRSVSKGNFFRIRSAFAYGARKLEKLLRSPHEELAEKLTAFFLNTEKHGSEHRPDASVPSFEPPQVDIAVSCEAEAETKKSNFEASNKIVPQSEAAVAAKESINHVTQTDGVETQRSPSNETNQSPESVDHVNPTSEATMLCTNVHVLELAASNRDTHGAGDSSQTGKAKKVTTCKGKNPSAVMVEAPPATSRRRAKGTNAINATGIQKRNPSLELESTSLANELTLNSRGHIENAKDLASYQHGSCNCGLPNNLEKQILIKDSITNSSDSGTSSSLAPSLSCKARLKSQANVQAQGRFHEANGGKENIESEILGSDQGQVLSMELSLCSQQKTNDRHNGPCADSLLVPSTVQSSTMLAGHFLCSAEASKSQLTSALHKVSSVANPQPRGPVTASVCSTSSFSEYGEEQNHLDYKEHPRNPLCPCSRRDAAREAWSGSTHPLSMNERSAAVPVVPPGFSAITAGMSGPSLSKKGSTVIYGNELVGSRAEVEDGSGKILAEVLELEASSGLSVNGSETRRLEDMKRGTQENLSKFSKKNSGVNHVHDSVSSITDANGCGKNVAKVVELEAGSGLEVTMRGVGLKAGVVSEENTLKVGKERNYNNSVSSSNGGAVNFGAAEEIQSVLIGTGIDDTVTRDEEVVTSPSLAEGLAVHRKQRTPRGASWSSVSPVSSQEEVSAVNGSLSPVAEPSVVGRPLSDRLRPTDHTEMMPFTYYYPAPLFPFLSVTNLPVYNMNPISDGKDRLDQGGTSLGTNHLENPHEASRDEPVVFGVGETLMASGIPVTAGSGLDSEAGVGVSEGAELKHLQADILRGDFAAHLHSLEVGRCFQNSHFHGPLLFASPSVFPPRHIQEHYAWEGPGRPTTAMFTQMLSYRHGILPNPPLHGANLHNTFAVQNGTFGEELPKFHRGTGTYLPNMRPGSYRDRQLTGGGRGQRGVKSLDRSDTVNHDGTHAFVSRYRGMGRGQNKHDGRSHSSKLNTRLERNIVERKLGEKGWDDSREETEHRSTLFTPPVNSSPNVGNFIHSSKRDTDLGLCIVPDSKNDDDTPSTGINWPSKSPVVMAYTDANNKAFSTEKLEFGSFGPFKLGVAQEGNDQDASAGKENAGCAFEKQHNNKHGEPTESGERLTRKVSSNDHHQSSSQCSYQLKEEDFPPLPFCGQPGRSAGFNVEKTPENRGSHYQACVVGPSS